MNVIIGIVGFLCLIGILCCFLAYKEFRRVDIINTDDEAENEETAEENSEGDMAEHEVLSNFVAKTIIVGSKGVGKTLLWSRYTRGLIPNPNIPTKKQSEDIFESKDLVIKENDVKLLVWDTSGL